MNAELPTEAIRFHELLCKEQELAACKELLKTMTSRVTWFVSRSEGELHSALYDLILSEIEAASKATSP